MNHIVAFSGGLTSSIVAKIVCDKYPNAILLFHDTKTEPDDNYRFRRVVARYLKKDIMNCSDGRDIWQLFKDENYLGNARNTMCSRVLKKEKSLEFCEKNWPCILYFGFTIEEISRAQNTMARYEQAGIKTAFPLIEQKLSKEYCLKTIKDCWGIIPPQMYEHFKHANCMPCIKGKKTYWGLVYKYERIAWERACQAEKEHGYTILTDGGTLQEELANTIRLAEVFEKKIKTKNQQQLLFDMPCECIA